MKMLCQYKKKKSKDTTTSTSARWRYSLGDLGTLDLNTSAFLKGVKTGKTQDPETRDPETQDPETQDPESDIETQPPEDELEKYLGGCFMSTNKKKQEKLYVFAFSTLWHYHTYKKFSKANHGQIFLRKKTNLF